MKYRSGGMSVSLGNDFCKKIKWSGNSLMKRPAEQIVRQGVT